MLIGYCKNLVIYPKYIVGNGLKRVAARYFPSPADFIFLSAVEVFETEGVHTLGESDATCS